MAGLSELIVFPGGQLPRKRLQDTDNFGTGFEGTSGRFVVKTTFQRSTGFTATMRTFSVSNVFSDVPRNKSAVRALGGASFQFAVLLLVVDACVWGGCATASIGGQRTSCKSVPCLLPQERLRIELRLPGCLARAFTC